MMRIKKKHEIGRIQDAGYRIQGTTVSFLMVEVK